MNNSSTSRSSYTSLHTPFYVIYIVVAIVFLILQIRFITIIQWTKELARLPSYRIAQHSSIACAINVLTQLIAALFTFSDDKMNETLNWIWVVNCWYSLPVPHGWYPFPHKFRQIISGEVLLTGSWAAEYPMISILAAFRLIAVALPYSMDRICNSKTSNVLLTVCWAFGVFNGILCLSGGLHNVWNPRIPAFMFTGRSFVADFMYIMDFYFAAFILFLGLLCYIALFILILIKRDVSRTMKVEGPLILHFGTLFIMTAVSLFVWHHPLGHSDLYGHASNLYVLLRFCISPLLALITNRIVREKFLPRRAIYISTITVAAKKRKQ